MRLKFEACIVAIISIHLIDVTDLDKLVCVARPVEANLSIKSTSTRYGAVAIAIHWLSALLIAGQLIGGFVAAQASDAQIKASILRAHVPIGLIVLGLTLFRVGWWAFADRKPRAAEDLSPLEALAAEVAHFLLYVAMLALALPGVPAGAR